MDRNIEKRMADRAVEIGRKGESAAFLELVGFLKMDSQHVRRLSASAIGKLAGLVDAKTAVEALQPLLQDQHPQVRQYAVKAIMSFGAEAASALADIQDMAVNPSENDYNQRDAQKAVSVIREALRIKEEQAEHKCQRCCIKITADEYARSMKNFQRIYCDKCFDEVFLKRRNYDTIVEDKKTIETRSGTFVQSDGERLIADYLKTKGINFRYDERIRLIDGYAVRPDFYLPEFDLYIEYWGMDTLDYKIGMMKKQKLYQLEGKKLISLYFKDKPRLSEILDEKLSAFSRQ